jgi:hypothetical protein
MNIPLDEVMYFDCITSHPSTGAATDADSTPTFAVYEESTDTDIGVGGNLTKRTSLTGNYRGTFTLSAANGFEVGKWYSVIVSATVNAIAGKGVAKNFRVVAAEVTAGYLAAIFADRARTWWVTKAGSDSNNGTRANPFLTINAALAVVSPFDTIKINGAGTWDETFTYPCKYLTIEGIGDTTIISKTQANDLDKVITMVDGGMLRSVRVTAVTKGCPLSAISTKDCSADAVLLEGLYDGLQIGTSNNFRGTRLRVTGTYDAINIQGAKDFHLSGGYARTNGTYTGFLIDYRAICGGLDATGVIENMELSATSANAVFNHAISAVENSGTAGRITLRDCDLIATATAAGMAGQVSGIKTAGSYPGAVIIDKQGGSITTSIVSGSSEYSVDASQSGSNVTIKGVKADRTKFNGVANITDHDDRPTNAELATALDATQDGIVSELPTADDNATTLLATDNGGETVGAQLEHLDDDISNVAGGGGTADLTDINLEPVPDSRRFVLVPTSDEGLVGDSAKSVMVGYETTISVSFENDLSANGHIRTVDDVILLTGSGITISNWGREGSEAKFRVEATAAGSYEIEVAATYNTGSGGRGVITLNVPPPQTAFTGGVPGSVTEIELTDIDQEPVPTDRVFVLLPTSGSGLVCEARKSLRAGTPAVTFAADFHKDLSANGRVATVSSVQLVSGTVGGLTIGGTFGRDHTQAKFTLAGITAGIYVFNVAVVYANGDGARGQITIEVVN